MWDTAMQAEKIMKVKCPRAFHKYYVKMNQIKYDFSLMDKVYIYFELILYFFYFEIPKIIIKYNIEFKQNMS